MANGNQTIIQFDNGARWAMPDRTKEIVWEFGERAVREGYAERRKLGIGQHKTDMQAMEGVLIATADYARELEKEVAELRDEVDNISEANSKALIRNIDLRFENARLRNAPETGYHNFLRGPWWQYTPAQLQTHRET